MSRSSRLFLHGNFGCCSFPESPIPGHEHLQHVRDQLLGIYNLAIRLRVQRGLSVVVGLQAGRTSKGQLDALGLGQRPQLQFLGRTHRIAPLLKNSGWYGRSTKSRLTMMRTGRPGRSVSVGWMFMLRLVTS